MNYLNFTNQHSFMNAIQKMSNDDITLHRKSITKLLETIKFDYNLFRSNLYSKYIINAKKLSSLKDEIFVFESYKKLLKKLFNYSCSINKSLNAYKQFDDSSLEDFDCDRNESINIIEETSNKISNENESGYYDQLESLSTLVMNQSALFYNKLTNEYLLNKDFINQFSNTPKNLFGGLDENNNPDFKHSLNTFIYQLVFDIDFVEGHI